MNVAVLHLQHPGYGPFALGPERDVANDCMHGIGVEVCCELGIVDAAGRADRRLEDLQIGIISRAACVTEGVGAFGSRPRLRLQQKLHRLREPHGPRGQPGFIIHDAVRRGPSWTLELEL